jgi:hypothetical protein
MIKGPVRFTQGQPSWLPGSEGRHKAGPYIH